MTDSATPERRWKQLDRTERRVVGVLVEKSKTTADNYPMTLNAITTACNQKNNRYPLMTLSSDEVQNALDRLRRYQAVMEVQSDGRVPKYKHLLYEWLGVEKIELSVMAELLLRGQQTLGDLRVRAGRMDEIPSQERLRELLNSLVAKDLVVELTPPGRGQIVTHNLYHVEELLKVRNQVAAQSGGAVSPTDEAGDGDTAPNRPSSESPASSGTATAAAGTAELLARISELEQLVAALQQRVQRLEDLWK